MLVHLTIRTPCKPPSMSSNKINGKNILECKYWNAGGDHYWWNYLFGNKVHMFAKHVHHYHSTKSAKGPEPWKQGGMIGQPIRDLAGLWKIPWLTYLKSYWRKSKLCPYSEKYQGVKEFHMLAHIGCNCKIMVFSPSNLWMPQKCTVKMCITPQNMPQTSNFLLSPTKSMVARGNQW